VFEILQKFSDTSVTEHEGCGGKVERLISAPSLQFKGTGFYITDYARGSGGAKGEINRSESGKGDSSGRDSKENKSEGKESQREGKESKSESKESKGDHKGGEKSESKSEAKPESKSESKSESKPAPASTKSD
jgi:predicted nucleic acid-binding Zn ribbon protein